MKAIGVLKQNIPPSCTAPAQTCNGALFVGRSTHNLQPTTVLLFASHKEAPKPTCGFQLAGLRPKLWVETCNLARLWVEIFAPFSCLWVSVVGLAPSIAGRKVAGSVAASQVGDSFYAGLILARGTGSSTNIWASTGAIPTTVTSIACNNNNYVNSRYVYALNFQ